VPIGPIRVVQIQEAGLRKGIGSTASPSQKTVALQLYRPPVLGLGNQRNRGCASRHGRRIMLRFAVDIALGLLRERGQVLFRTTASRGESAQPRQHEASGHEFDPITPGFTAGCNRSTRGKLTVHPLPELRLLGQLVKRTPVLRADLRLRASRGNRFHQRWQVEQLWPGCTFQSCTAFFPSKPSFFQSNLVTSSLGRMNFSGSR